MIWGQVRRVVVDSAGVVINMGRRQRLFRGNARQAILLQSSRCVIAGCATPIRRCEADHLTEWGRHGHTDGPNGAPVCGRHNRLKNSGYRVHRDDERLLAHLPTRRHRNHLNGSPTPNHVPGPSTGERARAAQAFLLIRIIGRVHRRCSCSQSSPPSKNSTRSWPRCSTTLTTRAGSGRHGARAGPSPTSYSTSRRPTSSRSRARRANSPRGSTCSPAASRGKAPLTTERPRSWRTNVGYRTPRCSNAGEPPRPRCVMRWRRATRIGASVGSPVSCQRRHWRRHASPSAGSTRATSPRPWTSCKNQRIASSTSRVSRGAHCRTRSRATGGSSRVRSPSTCAGRADGGGTSELTQSRRQSSRAPAPTCVSSRRVVSLQRTHRSVAPDQTLRAVLELVRTYA